MEHISERDIDMNALKSALGNLTVVKDNPQDPPAYCLHPEDYRGCDSNYIYIADNMGRKCRCAFERDGIREAEKFAETIPERIKKNGTSFGKDKEYQLPVVKKILPEKVNGIYRRPMIGAYLYGETGLGKSHLCFYAMAQLIKYSGRRVIAAWVEAKELTRIWEEIHGENKNKALKKLQNLIDVEILFIDECEKFGNMTVDRESEFFYLIKKRHDAMRYTLIASQVGLHEFCQRMPTEQVEYDKHGHGPAERRLREMCTEIHLVREAQQRIEP